MNALRRPCEHFRYEEHIWMGDADKVTRVCPGGVFLPDDTLNLDALTEAFTASEGIFHQEDGWAELNDHGILIFDAAVEYLKLFRGEDALSVREAE